MINTKTVCYGVSATSLVGAGAFFVLADDKGLGALFILLAALVCRVLILNVAERQE